MSRVTIGGKTIISNGSISIINGKVFIDGIEQDTGNEKEINISVEGNVESLNVGGCKSVKIKGDVGSITSSSGDIDIIGNVSARVNSSSGNIDISGNVSGDVQASSGNIKCGKVDGSVKTHSGNIKHI